MKLTEYDYNRLKNGEVPYVLVNKNSLRDYSVLHIYSGSFNPLHDMHRLIFKSMPTSQYPNSILHAYEMSIVPRNKEELDYEEICRRLEQFDKDTVIVTNADYYVRKAGALRGNHTVTFHIGFDTAARHIQDDTVLGVEGIHAKFVVYARDGKGIEQFPVVPRNYSEGIYHGTYVSGVSSTDLRKQEETKSVFDWDGIDTRKPKGWVDNEM